VKNIVTFKLTWWFSSLLTAFTIFSLFTPTQVSMAQTGPTSNLPACQITAVTFGQSQYEVGDIIELTVHLADLQGNPLVGAVVKADVLKTAMQHIQAIEGFSLIDRIGEYDGNYVKTDVTGKYEFKITANDPTSNKFTTCSITKDIWVGVTVPPTSTVIVPTATATKVVFPTATSVAPTATSVNPTATLVKPTATVVTPTATSIKPTATVTPTATSAVPTPTIVPGSQVIGFQPNKVTFSDCNTPNSMAVTVRGLSGLVGVELEINYDPQIVQVVDFDSNKTGVQIEAGSAFPSGSSFVVQNSVDTSAGIISFAATLLGDQISSDANLIVIHWKPQKNGSSIIKLNKVSLADKNGNSLTATSQTGTVEVNVTCQASVSGTVILQGQRDYHGVTVSSSTGDSVLTDAQGNFTVNGGEPIVVKIASYLSGRAEIGTASKIANGATVTNLGRITLMAGDVNNDNVINIFDLAYLATRLYTADTLADLNKDGQVNIFDLSLAASNYQKNGPLTDWQ